MQFIKEIKKRVQIPAWIFVAVMAVYGEFLLHIWTTDPILPGRLLAVLTFGLAFGGLLAFITSLFPAKAQKWIALGLSLVLAVLYLMEYFINDAYQNFLPISVVLAGAEGVANGFLSTVLSLLLHNWWRILLMLLPSIVLLLLGSAKKSGWKLRAILAGAAVVLYGLSFGVVYGISGDATRFHDTYDFDSAVHCFGLNVALPLDMLQSSSATGGNLDFVVPETSEPVQATEATDGSDAAQETTETTEATEPPVVYEEQVLDIDFAALAESERDPNIASLHAYVASQTPSMENEYTGLFEGKNLILITAEAFTGEVIDPELSPTLYRMATEGIYFTDYYQPVWGAGTTGGEFSNVVGLVPHGGACMYNAVEQDLFLTMGNQLQKMGYTSAAFHNNDYTYYDRHKTHTYLGYDLYMGYGNGIEEGVKAQWTESDQEMFDFTIPMYIDKQPFSLYYMTVSGHSAYAREGNAMSEKNYHMVEHLTCSETIKCYLAANLELENAMASLIRQLEEAGIADDTVIVISADHYPYGLAESSTWGTRGEYLTELFGTDHYDEFIRDQNALIIWSGCLEDMDIVVDEPVYSLDVLPTLSNLFGLEYDSRLLVGRDVFSDAEPLVLWKSYSWKTDKGTYDSSTRTFTPAEGVEVEEGYVDYITTIVRNKITYSVAVQNYDYFNDVVEAMNAEKTE